MIARLQHPLFGAAVGVLLSVGAGVYVSVRTLVPLLQQPVAAPTPILPLGLVERGWDFWTVEIDNLSSQLKEERARLKKQGEVLEQKAARMAAEEKELARLRHELERLRRDIADKVTEVAADEMKNIRTLAQTYASLTPKAAVAILKEIDDTTAVKILALMKAETVGPIFEEMTKTSGPEGPLARRAALLSEKLRLVRLAPAAGKS